MNCQELTPLLQAYLDQELDLVRSLEVEEHLKDCPACAERYAQQQALRNAVAGSSLYFSAPPALRQRVRQAIQTASNSAPQTASNAAATRTRRSQDLSWLRFWWLAPAALAALVVLLAWPLLLRPSADTRLAQAIVSAHARSLMVEHLTDVASTDQHTVKPWFNGKLTFSPPVTDLDGFPLVGGRLDVIEEQPVAALVYQRHKHFINLFLWPSSRSGASAEKALAQRGYNLLHWTAAGMECWAISDVSTDDLQRFAQLVREHMLPPQGK